MQGGASGQSSHSSTTTTVETQATSSTFASTFEIPLKFSRRTMEAIETGGIVCKSARVEIVNSLYSRMLQHIEYPTHEHYKVACWRLVGQYSNLKDKLGTGIVSTFSVKN